MQTFNFPELIIGGVIGAIFGFLPSLIARLRGFLRYRRDPSRLKYQGKWVVYYRTTSGTGEVRREEMSVTYSKWWNKLEVRVVEPGSDGESGSVLNYKGYLTDRRGLTRYLYLRDPISHLEETWCIFDSFFDPVNETSGVIASVDAYGLPAAVPVRLYRSEQPLERVEKELDAHVIRTAIKPGRRLAGGSTPSTSEAAGRGSSESPPPPQP